MRILVYLDTPRQTSTVETIRSAFAGDLETIVFAAGPGVTETFFGIEGDVDGSAKTHGLSGRRQTFLAAYRENVKSARDRWHATRQRLIRSMRRLRPSVLWARARLLARWLRPALKRFLALRRRRHVRARPVLRPVGPRRRRRFPFAPTLKRAFRFGARASFNAMSAIGTLRRKSKRKTRRMTTRTRVALMSTPVGTGIAYLIVVVGLPAVILRGASGFSYYLLERREQIANARLMVRRCDPDLVVLLEDNVEGLTGAAAFAARAEGVPFIVLPDYIPNPLEPARYYAGSADHQVTTLADRLVARLRPRWVFFLEGKRMLRLPPAKIAAYHVLRSVPPRPWILNSGYASAITLDSPAIVDHYKALGFRNDKLRIIGTARDDELFRMASDRSRRRGRLRRKIAFPKRKRLVVCAFPPDQYGSGEPGAFEFADFDSMAEAWFAALAGIADHANVVVRPHPRLAPERLRRFETETVRVAMDDTAKLVPLADLYVASISTTIKWALALGIPTVNYDSYRYRYGDFSSAKGSVSVESASDFAAVLTAFAEDPGWFSEMRSRAMEDAANWGVIDGGYRERLRDLIAETVRNRVVFRSTHA